MHSTIYEMTERLVQRFGTRDPFELAEALKIEIMRSNRIKKLSGMYMYILRNPYIVINSNVPEQLQRIVCAHEIGHDRLHRALAAGGIMKETALFDITTRPEYEANVFAAEFLLTDESIIALSGEGADVFQMASRLESDVNIVSLKIAQMKKRGYPFEVDTSFYDRHFI